MPDPSQPHSTTKRKPQRRYVYMKWRVLVDPRTGEDIRALVASSNVDRSILAGRKFPADGRVRVEIKNPRNAGFHRLVHVFGCFLVMHVDGYEQFVTARNKPDAHAAVKECQARSGVGCEKVTYDLDIPGMGMTQVTRTEPRSVSFDEMDEDEFQSVFQGMIAWVAEHEYPDLTPEQIADFESLMEQP